MVDTPKITPQATARGGVSSVPTLRNAAIPDVTGIGMVRPTGFERLVDSLGMQASMLEQQSKMFGMEAQKIADDEREKQQAEAERIFAEKALEASEGIELARQGIKDSSEALKASMGAYDSVVSKTFENDYLTPYQKQYLQGRFAAERVNVGRNSLTFQSNLREEEFKFNIARTIEYDATEASKDPLNFDTIIKKRTAIINTTSDGNYLLKKQLIERMEETVADAAVRSMIEQQPDAAEDALKSGMFDKYMDADKVSQFIDAAQAKQRGEDVQLTPEEIKRKSGIATRLQTDPYSVTDDEIFSLMRDGLIKDDEAVRYMTTRDKNKEKKNGAIEEMKRVVGALNGENLLSPTSTDDKKAVQTYYDAVIAPALEEAEPGERSLIITNFVDSVGMVPESVTNEITAKLTSGGVQQKLEAVDLINRIEERAIGSNLDLGLRDEDYAYADIVNGKLLGAENPEEAIKQTDILMSSRNESFSKLRRENFTKEFDFVKSERMAEDKLGGWGATDATTETFANLRLQQDLHDMALNYYMVNPDMKAAMKYAVNNIQKAGWGVTKVGGQERLMKHPPEMFYGVESKIITDDLISDLKASGIEEDIENIHIGSDPITAREVQAGKRPAYSVYKVTENGIEYIYDENNKPLRYYPNEDKIKMKQIKEQANKAAKNMKLRKIEQKIEDLEAGPSKELPKLKRKVKRDLEFLKGKM